jgi:rSAM/selenodomain-associated transferase 2
MRLEPELSIVIPTLNEEENLKEILSCLTLQKGVGMEIIISDGGSSDSTCKIAEKSDCRISLLKGEPGRALQLNAGAAAAKGEFILFLHADSRFDDELALRRSLDALCKAASGNNGRLHAGHFAIRFRRDSDSRSFGYRYLECKAMLGRKGCSHGDQGILIPAELFREYGGFDRQCQALAETRLADRLIENGQWLLLPSELSTSIRRFEKEGMKERQALNAVIMALGAAGLSGMIDVLGLYLPQNRSSKLQLQPLFRKIEQKISSLEERARLDFREKIGVYICENAWQIPFGLDVMMACRAANPARGGNYRLLKLHDQYLKRFTANRMSARIAGYAGSLWLKYMAWR